MAVPDSLWHGMYVTTERVGKKNRIHDTLSWITPEGLFEAPLTVPNDD